MGRWEQDPEFRRRIEAAARDRAIQRRLAAIRLRYGHTSLDEIAVAVRRGPPYRGLSGVDRPE